MHPNQRDLVWHLQLQELQTPDSIHQIKEHTVSLMLHFQFKIQLR